MASGWIKLHRQLLDNEELMRSDNAFKLFMVLLLLVDKDTATWSGGRFQLSKIAKIPNGSSYKALKRLETLEMVALNSSSQYTVIRICNWEKYQGEGSSNGSYRVAAGKQQGSTLTRIENKEIRNTNAPANADIDKLLNEKGNIQHDWQFLGLEIFEKASAPANKRSECMRIAKSYPQEQVMSALSFAIDYPTTGARWKMFLWKLNNLIKDGSKNK